MYMRLILYSTHIIINRLIKNFINFEKILLYIYNDLTTNNNCLTTILKDMKIKTFIRLYLLYKNLFL